MSLAHFLTDLSTFAAGLTFLAWGVIIWGVGMGDKTERRWGSVIAALGLIMMKVAIVT